MFGIGFLEILVIAVAALVLFGPEKLPEIAAQLGRVFVHFRRITSDVRSEIDDAIRKAEHDIMQEERVKLQRLLEEKQHRVVNEVKNIQEKLMIEPEGQASEPLSLGSEKKAPWEVEASEPDTAPESKDQIS